MLKLNFQKIKIILLYYSTIFSTILIVGGFYIARSGKEIISNLFFLPIVIFFWITLVEYRKEKKATNLVEKITTRKRKK